MNIFNLLLIQPLANGLVVFYDILFHNLGLSIIFFSLFLRLILNPLTKPYMESMKKMRELQPQLDKLKKKHKGDRAKIAQAQADLYKNKGVKPGAGCLPYLLQIVILIAFFRVFMISLGAENPTESLNALLYPALQLAPGEVLNTQFFIWDLAVPNTFMITGIPFALPGVILIAAAAVQFLSAKITQPYNEMSEKVAKKTEGEADDFQASMQKSLILTMPLFTIVFGMRFPAGLALYWLVFSATQAYQQYSAQGWGGLTPWLNRVGLVKSQSANKKGKKLK